MDITTECYIEHGGKTLMLHRTKKANDPLGGYWVGLGGHVEEGESPEECIMREVREESGLEIASPRLRGVITFCEQEHSGNNVLMFLYTANAFTGALAECPEGELEWVETARMHELPMYEGDALFLRWMREDGIFSAKFCYDAQGRLVSHTRTVYGGEKG